MIRLQALEVIFGDTKTRTEGWTDRRGSLDSYLDEPIFAKEGGFSKSLTNRINVKGLRWIKDLITYIKGN